MRPDTAEADGIDSRGGASASAVVREEEEELRTVHFDPELHRTKEFVCKKSDRIQGFFANEAVTMVPRLYCRVFILPKAPSPDDPTDQADPSQIWGYYTLSAGLLYKETMSRPDERKVLPYPAPVVRIGFMGTDDRAPRGLGRGLLIDAARRVYRKGRADIGV